MNAALNFKLDLPSNDMAFEGPLDLLLSLIEKNKINIFDIPISLILDQYNEYIEGAKLRDMNVAAEFIEMSARLIHIKCRMLLPRSEGDDPREELVRDLLLYAQMKNAAEYFNERYDYFADRYEKDPEAILSENEPENEFEYDNLFPAAILTQSLKIIVENNREKAKLYNIADKILPKRPRASVSEKYIYILRKSYGQKTLTFTDFLKMDDGFVRIDDVIAALNAVLRLVTAGTLICGENPCDGEHPHGGDLNILECGFELNRKKKRKSKVKV